MLSHSPDLAANIVKSSATEKRCYRCQRAVFFNGCECVGPIELQLSPQEIISQKHSLKMSHMDYFVSLFLTHISFFVP
jgi:hypothetical protein